MSEVRNIDISDTALRAAEAVDELKDLQGEKMTLNMGPSHPATHGVLRLSLELDGEIITKADPEVGYLHRGDEKIAENMILSKQTSAHVMTTVEVDYENIAQLREKIKDSFKEQEGFSLTYLPFIGNATIAALKEYPVVNSSFDLDKDSHIIHSQVDLGIAVDINQEGLLVGTIKKSDSYDVKNLAKEITVLSKKLREKDFTLEDVSGSTFTISNNGSFNSFLTSPIINQPNVAILSTESVKKKAVVVESEDNGDSIEIRHMGILSLTWDHRVFDGSTALLFLNAIKDKLEKHDWSGEIT